MKESDRIAALAAGLASMGARVEEFPDGLRVLGRASVQSGACAPMEEFSGRLAGLASVQSGAGASPVGVSPLHGAELDSRDDHRIAMALSIAALGASGDSVIRDPECVAASFPEIFALLESITRVS